MGRTATETITHEGWRCLKCNLFMDDFKGVKQFQMKKRLHIKQCKVVNDNKLTEEEADKVNVKHMTITSKSANYGNDPKRDNIEVGTTFLF